MIFLDNFYKVTSYKMMSVSLTAYPIQYEQKKWIYPKIGKIFVFNSLSKAQEFKTDCQRLFRRQVINPVEIIRVPWWGDLSVRVIIQDFWNNNAGIFLTPAGSMVVDQVKLMEEIC